MRIGFFGGSFDPPHFGHLAVSKAASDAFYLDKVLFVPTAHQPLKPQGTVASYHDRLEMVSLLCQLEPADTHFEASNLDAPREDERPNYTADTIGHLRSTMGERERLFMIVGADAFAGLPRWHSSAKLLRMADWIVVSRPAFHAEAVDTVRQMLIPNSHIHLLSGIEVPISATSVRERLGKGQDCEGLLPLSILSYIRRNRLYGMSSPEHA